MQRVLDKRTEGASIPFIPRDNLVERSCFNGGGRVELGS